jgi:hypothetical protein
VIYISFLHITLKIHSRYEYYVSLYIIHCSHIHNGGFRHPFSLEILHMNCNPKWPNSFLSFRKQAPFLGVQTSPFEISRSATALVWLCIYLMLRMIILHFELHHLLYNIDFMWVRTIGTLSMTIYLKLCYITVNVMHSFKLLLPYQRYEI